jgi:exonuclease SbcD
MIRFIHTADIHLGVENYGIIDQKTGINSRLLDFNHALYQCIQYAINTKVDFFLFCGDAYKTATPTPTQQKLLLNNFLQLYNAKIPVVIIIGNHDNPLSFGKVHALDLFGDLPLDGFHVISKPQHITLNTAHGPVAIVGIPWPTKASCALNNHALTQQQVNQHITSTITAIIDDLAREIDPKIPAILAGHLTVSSGVFSGSEKRAIHGNDPTFLPSQLAKKPFAYVALGHLHRHQVLNKTDGPPLVYAGSLERIDFGERNDHKCFCEVTLACASEKFWTAAMKSITVNTRPFVQIDLKINEHITDQTAYVLSELKNYALTNTIVKITYELATGVKDRLDIKAIQQACAHAHYVAGIQAIRHIQHRERRSNAHIDMDLQSLLQEYFKQKPALNERRESLLEKIMALKQELELPYYE